jgi:hypothetical protein
MQLQAYNLQTRHCIFRTLTTPSQHPLDETKIGRPKVHLILDVEHELVGKYFLRTSRLKRCMDADFMTDSGGIYLFYDKHYPEFNDFYHCEN